MLAIYRYTFYKYIKSISTWVILVFSALLIGFIVGGLVPFLTLKTTDFDLTEKYIRAVVSTTSGTTVFLAIFASVFAGFKSATMYRDEVENGTFLTILSKPITRSQIILGKWLSLQSMLALYSFLSVLFFCIGIAIFDKGDIVADLVTFGIEPIRNQIAFVGIFAFIIVYVACLIFSSIALLLSTRISVAATAGIMIAIGIVIPITSLLSLFLRRNPVYPIVAVSESIADTRSRRLSDANRAAITENFAAIPAGVTSPDAATLLKALYSDTSPEQLAAAATNSKLDHLALKTQEIDSYTNAWVADLNYQFSTLAQFAYERAIPNLNKLEIINNNGEPVAAPGAISKLTLIRDEEVEDIVRGVESFYSAFDKPGSREAQAAIVGYLAILKKALPNFVVSVDATRTYYAINDRIPQGTIPSPQLLSVLKIFSDKLLLIKPTLNISELTAVFNYIFQFNTFNTSSFSIMELLDYNLAAPSEAFYRRELLKTTSDIFSSIQASILTSIITNGVTNTVSTAVGATPPISTADYQKLYNSIVQAELRVRYTLSPYNYMFQGQESSFGQNNALGNPVPSAFDKYQSDTKQKIRVAYADVGEINGLVSNAVLRNLVTFERDAYVDKNYLLIGYVVVALVLAPIVFPIIKRQDFR